ncbi:hypothetical protein T439DRAFT_47455 [Meredithblackwellia eburnea MCA 4105]
MMNKLRLPSMPSLPSFSLSSSSNPTSPGDQLTDPPIDPDQLAILLRRKQTTTNWLAVVQRFARNYGKRKSDPTSGGVSKESGEKEELIEGWCARVASEAAEDKLHGDDQFTSNLESLGTTYRHLSTLLDSFLTQIDESILPPLQDRVQLYKEFEKILKEADKARSALEAILVKSSKLKEKDVEKKSQDLEAETHVLQRVYDDASEVLRSAVEEVESGYVEEESLIGEWLRLHTGQIRNRVRQSSC